MTFSRWALPLGLLAVLTPELTVSSRWLVAASGGEEVESSRADDGEAPAALTGPTLLPTTSLPSSSTPSAGGPAINRLRAGEAGASAESTRHNVLREAATTATPDAETSPPAKTVAMRPATAVPREPVEAGETTKPAAPTTNVPKTTAAPKVEPARSEPNRTPSVMLAPGEEPPSQKATLSNQPVDVETKKLFESKVDAKPLTPELEYLRRRVQTALALYYRNWTLNTREHSPWEVMHAIIAYGVDTRLMHNGRPITAIGHLCYSGICEHQAIVTLRENQIYVHRGPGVQGHSGQFLAILAQSHLQRDYPMYIGGQQYTLEDLIAAEQLDCESDTELTFKLIGLMHYLPSDATWKNFQGQTWSLDRLVREEIIQPIRGAACGGTHRLMGLSYAVRKRAQRGEPIDGIYLEAQKYIEQYHRYTFGLQNSDGSFSTAWFVRREARLDLDRRLQTTGHVLEWLCFSLSDEQLRDPRVVKSVKYVTDQLLDVSSHQWEVGHLGHALHALQLYNERVFGGPIRSYESLVVRPGDKPAR